ncbi:hypothetical protein Ahy_A06g026171 isoform C [Arachis hypogaea]|uniref:Uncharacterized protein n=1 Tax=Arachis hypogaea TaxID=3818 RepID=A0A445CJM9_ARAHY|nr:hypothetical protein Ahy_A06g026171 isoform C [Arachis hypogaea]
MDQRPNSTNTTNTASLELLPLFKESKEQEDESIIRRKRSSSCFVDQPSKMSRSELLYKAVFFQGCQLLVIMEKIQLPLKKQIMLNSSSMLHTSKG